MSCRSARPAGSSSAIVRPARASSFHGNRARVPPIDLDDSTRARVVQLAQTTYVWFNPVHLAETLAEETDQLGLSAPTIGRILAAVRIAATQTRR